MGDSVAASGRHTVTAGFTSDLIFVDLNRHAEPNSKRIQLKLLVPLFYTSALLNRQFIVPSQFVTDLASVPQFLWAIVPPIGKYDDAAVLHDWLYKQGGVTRKEADDLLKEAMQACGVSGHDVWMIYNGVRLGGWLTWRRYRKEGQVEAYAR